MTKVSPARPPCKTFTWLSSRLVLGQSRWLGVHGNNCRYKHIIDRRRYFEAWPSLHHARVPQCNIAYRVYRLHTLIREGGARAEGARAEGPPAEGARAEAVGSNQVNYMGSSRKERRKRITLTGPSFQIATPKINISTPKGTTRCMAQETMVTTRESLILLTACLCFFDCYSESPSDLDWYNDQIHK